MKFTIKTFALILMTGLMFIQCKSDKDDDEKTPSLDVEKSSVSSKQEGETLSVGVTAIHTDWNAEVADKDKDWCSVTKHSDRIDITTTENPDGGSRETTITLTAVADNKLSEEIKVIQFGLDPIIRQKFRT